MIEIHVKAGDEVAPEDPLVTLESEKATMDVPAPAAGKVTEVHVAIDDKVSEGSPILELEETESAGEEAPRPKPSNLSDGARETGPSAEEPGDAR